MIGTLSDRLASLSPEKRKIIEILRKAEGAESGKKKVEEGDGLDSELMKPPFALLSEQDRARLPPDLDIEDCYPMTMLQRGMVYQMELTANSSAPQYHNVNSFHLRVAYNLEAFEHAVNRVVARHATLRTSF